MRVIKEINHPACKITIFHWNGKYLIKLEQDSMEQTFKVDEFDVTDENSVLEIIDESFIKSAIERFRDMNETISERIDHM